MKRALWNWLLLVCGACGSPPVAAEASGWQRVVSSAGAWVVSYRSQPSPMPLGTSFDLELRVARADGAPLPADLQLRVDASMPQHQHGMLRRPTLHVRAPGEVRAEGLLFHMAGAWTLVFDVSSGPLTERAETVVQIE